MKNNLQTYWFITVFSKWKVEGYADGSFSALPVGRRTWGFYSNKDDALKALYNNSTDMWEYTYDYALLESYYEGIGNYNFNEEPMWFKYNEEKNSYELMEEPEGIKHYVSFAMG